MRRRRARSLTSAVTHFCIFAAAVLHVSSVLAQQPVSDDRAHRAGLIARLGELQAQGQEASIASFVQAEIEKIRRLGPYDARRGNVLEVSLMALMPRFGEERELAEAALPTAVDLVRIRSQQKPRDAELLAGALLIEGTTLFALDRSAEADRRFEQRTGVLREAFPGNDPRLADMLSTTARVIEEGYSRTTRAANLYSDAIRIRMAAGQGMSIQQAADMQALGMLQMNKLRDAPSGEDNLKYATDILETLLAQNSPAGNVADGLLQIYVLRSAIARQRAAPDEAKALLEKASGIPAPDAARRRQNANTVALGMASLSESDGDLDGALVQYDAIIDRIRSATAPDVSTDDENGLLLDVRVSKAALMLRQDRIEEARESVQAVVRLYPVDDPQLPAALFLLSEIERRSGHPEQQAIVYRDALRLSRKGASEQILLFATNRKPGKQKGAFGGDAAKALSFGKAIVLVPGGQFSTTAALRPKSLEAASYGAATDPDQLAIGGNPEIVSPDVVKLDADRAIKSARLYPKSALVFVHGYNVSFDDALKRMGQLKRDLNYDGAALLFSWPSAGHWWRYGTDRDSAEAAIRSLGELLAWIAHSTSAERIHVIGHSMGNRVLLPALIQAPADVRARIGEVVFASPAVGINEFTDFIARLTGVGLKRLTLYASRNDLALRAGAIREYGTTLAGYVASGIPFLTPGLDTIDASEGGNESFEFNHDVFAANPAVIDDIRQLLQNGTRPPGTRLAALEKRTSANGAVYWTYIAPRR
jgi:esterase/lipase superfamily enzyme